MCSLAIAAVLTLAGGNAFSDDGIAVNRMGGWTIVVADDAIPSEQYAAVEFQSLFKQVTGLELAIQTQPPKKRHNVFIAGASERELGDEGLRIEISRANITISGGRPRGTLYGVYEFFERYFGVRFMTYDHTYVPEDSRNRTLPVDSFSYVPPFSFRWSYYGENSEHPEFAAKRRVNTVTKDDKLGGIARRTLPNHSLYRWIDPAKYGSTHPEYFALVNGVRKLEGGGGGPEPCVTNPDVIRIVTEGVLKELDANPGMGSISVSQNDNDAYCKCPKCEEINQCEGTPMGSQLALVNAVAEGVEKRYPDVKITTLAYWYTRKPPKTIVPRKNVQICLCSIECCTFHPISDPACEKNREFCADVAAWRRVCDDILIWNYNTNFGCYDLPFPNLRAIGPNVRFFVENHAKGVFMQADGNGTSGEMSDLRNYVISGCLWNPKQDGWALAEEFCRLHYGDAAQPILDWLVMFHDNAGVLNVHPGCFAWPEEVGLNPLMATKGLACFEEARSRAKDEVGRARVEKASICAYKAAIGVGSRGWKYEDGFVRRDWPDEYGPLINRYIELGEKYKLTMVSEPLKASDYFAQLRLALRVPAMRIENDVWRLMVLPEYNGRLVEMFHKPTGRNLITGLDQMDLHKDSHQEMGLKGYDDSVPEAFTGEVSGTTIKLKKTLGDGSLVERSIALSPRNPDTIVFESALTHNGPAPKVYQVKSRPEFHLATASDDDKVICAYIKDRRWIQFNRGWKAEMGPEEGILKTARGGAFAFFDHGGRFGVLVTYDRRKIGYPLLSWHPEWSQLNLELFSPEAELQPGEGLSFSYQFRYLSNPPEGSASP